MSHHLGNAGAMAARRDELGREKLKELLTSSLFAIALTGCGLPTDRDVRASRKADTSPDSADYTLAHLPVIGTPHQKSSSFMSLVSSRADIVPPTVT